MDVALALVAFGGGLWLLMASVEGLVGALAGWAAASGLSALALSALVFGLDLESTAAGVGATLGDLPGTALGTSVGASVFLLTAGLGLAALAAPFSVRPPWPVLATAGAATLLPLVLAVDGLLSRLDGALLLAAWPPLVAVLVSSGRAGAGEGSGSRPARLLPRLLLGVAGIVVGAELLVLGTEGIVEALGLSETLFGLLVVGAAVSLEEVALLTLPARRGHPEIGVGNVLGTVVFLLTASLGIVALVRPVPVPEPVLALYLPALLAAVALACVLLARDAGRLGRSEGALLVVAYGLYLAGALMAGG